jgi:hypothetical protein
MANSQVAYYNSTGTSIFSKTLYTLINDVSLTNDLCDPKVIWDNAARHFIFYCQVCDQVSAHSKIILGFSKTSNPYDGWNFYKFSGDPTSQGWWWDYPKMAVSSDEVFVTGNLFAGNNFKQSVILQVQKAPCYAGTTPLSHLWSPSLTGGSGLGNAFTILPLGYGQSGSYGPGIYAVSFTGNDIFGGHMGVYDITNNIASGAAMLNTYDVVIANYGPPSNAPQAGPLPLNTGDNRPQDGFFLKRTLHVVHNIDVGGGFSGFRYYRLNVSTLALTTQVDYNNSPTTDACYPAIASAVNDSVDNSVVMAFEETSSSMFPRTSVVACDQSGTFSAPVVIQAGTGYIDYGSTGSERWGDYTGMCKRFGDPQAAVWMAGMYGSATHKWLQWIAKISPKNVGVAPVAQPQEEAKVFPNPVVDRYELVFNVPERQRVIINLTDMAGNTVAELCNTIIEAGQNRFSFNKGNLANGIYSLNIIGEKTNIKNEQIVIAGK